jgi:hypothetical protein
MTTLLVTTCLCYAPELSLPRYFSRMSIAMESIYSIAFYFHCAHCCRLTWMVEDLNVILLLDTFTMRCLESPTLDCWRRQCTAVHFFLNLLVMMILQLHQFDYTIYDDAMFLLSHAFLVFSTPHFV